MNAKTDEKVRDDSVVFVLRHRNTRAHIFGNGQQARGSRAVAVIHEYQIMLSDHTSGLRSEPPARRCGDV